MPSPLSQHYSDRLGTLDVGQLQEALSRWDLGTLLHAEPINSGLFGQNLFLSSNTGDYVLRGKPHSPSQFPGERFFARQLHENTNVPVAWHGPTCTTRRLTFSDVIGITPNTDFLPFYPSSP